MKIAAIGKSFSSNWQIISADAVLAVPVWLKGDLVISCDLTKIFFQLLEELLITLCLIQRHKGVDVSKLLPGDRLSMSKKKKKKKAHFHE